MYTHLKRFLTAALLALPVISHAQSNRLGSWDIATAMINPNNRFSFWVETQTRSQGLTSDFYYYETKGGAVYNIKKKMAAMLGVGNYHTFDYPGNFKGGALVKEFRLWEQLILNNNIDRVKIEHRYRIEQRWLNGEYRNRFRYRFNPVVPINHPTVVARTLYATAFDEIFFTNNAPYFERNRFFAGAGYQFSDLFAFQAGFIRQFDYNKTTDGTGKNSIQTVFLFYLDKHTLHPERRPNVMD